MAKQNENSNNKNGTDDNKVVPMQRRFRLNIGIVVFAVVVIYFLVMLIQYFVGNHVTVYEVEKGQIMVSSHYTGLVLRSETVTYSGESGSLNYFSSEGEKVGFGDLICSIDSEGSISERITAAGLDGTNMTMSDLLEVQEMITDYADEYSGDQFYNVYSFGRNLNSEVRENLYVDALVSIGDQTDSSTFSLVTAAQDGILAFYTDGYEGVTPDNFSADLFSSADYKKTNLNGNTSVSVGQALYKTVTDENWYIIVPIDWETSGIYRAMMGKDGEQFLLRVTFKKDGAQTYANAEVRNYDGEDFLVLSLNSSMIRYLSDRYLEVDLGSGENTGLKIPNSSIVTKEFLVVPEKYIVSGSNSSGTGVVRLSTDKQGNQYEEFISADIYYIDEDTGNYCLSAEGLELGDTVLEPDSTDRYIINSTAEHEGVYNVNKGYAVFKLIDKISSNGEYTIVETGTSYGLTLYDRIALDGDSLNEGDYVN